MSTTATTAPLFASVTAPTPVTRLPAVSVDGVARFNTSVPASAIAPVPIPVPDPAAIFSVAPFWITVGPEYVVRFVKVQLPAASVTFPVAPPLIVLSKVFVPVRRKVTLPFATTLPVPVALKPAIAPAVPARLPTMSAEPASTVVPLPYVLLPVSVSVPLRTCSAPVPMKFTAYVCASLRA